MTPIDVPHFIGVTEQDRSQRPCHRIPDVRIVTTGDVSAIGAPGHCGGSDPCLPGLEAEDLLTAVDLEDEMNGNLQVPFAVTLILPLETAISLPSGLSAVPLAHRRPRNSSIWPVERSKTRLESSAAPRGGDDGAVAVERRSRHPAAPRHATDELAGRRVPYLQHPVAAAGCEQRTVWTEGEVGLPRRRGLGTVHDLDRSRYSLMSMIPGVLSSLGDEDSHRAPIESSTYVVHRPHDARGHDGPVERLLGLGEH